MSFRIMVLKPKEQDSDLTSLGKDGEAWLSLSWLQTQNTVLTSLTWMEISSLISVKAELDQTLCLHILELCSLWFSLENSGEGVWGLCPIPWESVRLPHGFVCVPSLGPGLVLWPAGMSICSLESHLQWQGNGTSISLSLSSDSLGNTLEPLRRTAAPQIILFHTRESHRNSLMHLCPHLPYPICGFSPLILYHGFPCSSSGRRAWEGIEVPAVWQVLRHTFSFRLRVVCGIDSVWDVIVKGKPWCFETSKIKIHLSLPWRRVKHPANMKFLSCMQREDDSQLLICLSYR